VGYLGLPARYPGTPVETIARRDAQALSDALLRALSGRGGAVAGPPLPPAPPIVETTTGHEEAARLLAALVARYGATDGIPFLDGGAAMLPFSWPGRYSHSPIEVADLRDVEALVKLIVATAAEPSHPHAFSP
jgi:putative aminopeptidase FrvX